MVKVDLETGDGDVDWDKDSYDDGWMKNPKSAMISCNDGFRPVSFLLETVEDE